MNAKLGHKIELAKKNICSITNFTQALTIWTQTRFAYFATFRKSGCSTMQCSTVQCSAVCSKQCLVFSVFRVRCKMCNVQGVGWTVHCPVSSAACSVKSAVSSSAEYSKEQTLLKLQKSGSGGCVACCCQLCFNFFLIIIINPRRARKTIKTSGKIKRYT